MTITAISAGASACADADLVSTFWREVDHLARVRHSAGISPLARQVAQAVLTACSLALEDREAGRKVHRTLASGTGTGKSSYAGCFASALLKSCPNASVLFVVPDVRQADDTFVELSKLIDEEDIAIWTGGHDAGSSLEKIRSDFDGFQPTAPRFWKGDLDSRRLIITTHKLYVARKGVGSVLAYLGQPRTLHMIDERLQEVELMDLDLSDITKALTWSMEQKDTDPKVISALHALQKHLSDVWESEKAGPAGSFKALSGDALEWFLSEDAVRAERAAATAWVMQAIGFGRALAMGRAFLARYPETGHGGRFIGYRLDLPVVPGSVLMDGTSDIDGVNQIATWRAPVAPPRVTFNRLAIKHLPFPTVDPDGFGKNIKQITESADLSSRYASWIKDTILAESEPGESILVITHKAMIDQGRLPANLSFDDPLHMDGDRKVVFITYGRGVGSNRYKQATTVILCGEFWRPHRVTMGQVQGLRDVKASDDDLAAMANVKTKHALFSTIKNGHLLMWSKQLAMRGAARNFDDAGVCGKMKLVAVGDLDLWVKSHRLMFPGASFDMSEASKAAAKEAGGSKAVAEFLLGYPKCGSGFTSKDLCGATGVKPPNLVRYLKSAVVKAAMETAGLSYVPGQGRTPSTFIRWDPTTATEAA